MEVYNHLQGMEFLETESKEVYPIPVILGASEYPNIKKGVARRAGRIGEPIAELTPLGWIITSTRCGVE